MQTTTYIDGDKNPKPDSDKISGGTIFGIIIGVVILILFATLIVLTVLKQKRVISMKLPVIDGFLNRNNDNLSSSLLKSKNVDLWHNNPIFELK